MHGGFHEPKCKYAQAATSTHKDEVENQPSESMQREPGMRDRQARRKCAESEVAVELGLRGRARLSLRWLEAEQPEHEDANPLN